MKKVLKVVLIIVVILVVIWLGISVYASYKAKKEVLDDVKITAMKTDAIMLVRNIDTFCDMEKLKIEMGQNITQLCINNESIKNNIYNISEFMLENKDNYELIEIEYNEKVTKLKLKHGKHTVTYDGNTYTVK